MICLKIILLLGVCSVGWGLQTEFLMDQAPCTRLITLDGVTGCATPHEAGPNGKHGGLVLIESEEDVETFQTAAEIFPRVAVLSPKFVDQSMLKKLQNIEGFAGVVMTDPEESLEGFSPASRMENASSGLVWNPNGRDLLRRSFGDALVVMSGSRSSWIRSKARWNRDRGYNVWPQEAVRFSFDMGPSDLRSDVCLSRNWCLPLGGQSVWGSVGPFRKDVDSVFVVSALDSNALAHDLATGGGAEGVSMAVVVSALEALQRVEGVENLPLQIMVGLFQGAAFDNVGSRKWMRDVSDFTCKKTESAAKSPTGRPICKSPLKTDLTFTNVSLSQITSILSIDQPAHASTIFAHGSSSLFNTILPAKPSSSKLTYTSSSLPPHIPASSLFQNDSSTKGAVHPNTPVLLFSGYQSNFSDTWFHSSFDTSSNLPPNTTDNLAASATLLASSLYYLASNRTLLPPASLQIDRGFLSELTTCLTSDIKCPLFQNALDVSKKQMDSFVLSSTPSLYTNVYTNPYLSGKRLYLQPSLLEAAIRAVLANVTARVNATTSQNLPQINGTCSSNSDCDNNGYECIVHKCILPSIHFHDAVSPALEATAYLTFSLNRNNLAPNEKLWTEPYWSLSTGATHFLATDPRLEWTLLPAGFLFIATIMTMLQFVLPTLRTSFGIK